jgi:hypothetical protein
VDLDSRGLLTMVGWTKVITDTGIDDVWSTIDERMDDGRGGHGHPSRWAPAVIHAPRAGALRGSFGTSVALEP